jgi:hypothetical protein
MAMAEDQKQPGVEGKHPQMHMGMTGDPYTLFANYFSVQVTDQECFLTFLEFRPEQWLDTVFGKSQVRGGQARPIAEIMIQKSLVETFLKVVKETYDNSNKPKTVGGA